MKKNVGIADKIIRILVGIIIIALGLIYGSWWGVIGVIPIITGIVGYCCLYVPLGISTCKAKKITQ
jgi:putative effector of murein hydrolase LrgA (UPF0299 family)